MHFKWGCGIAASLKLTMYYCDPTFCLGCQSSNQLPNSEFGFSGSTEGTPCNKLSQYQGFFLKKGTEYFRSRSSGPKLKESSVFKEVLPVLLTTYYPHDMRKVY